MDRERSNKAWRYREEGENVTAIAIWWQMYREALENKNYSDAIDLLFDISVAWRNEGKKVDRQELVKASISTLKMAEYWAKTGGFEIREDFDYYLANALMDAGKYTEAAFHYKRAQQFETDPEMRMDIDSKMGYAYAKGGHIKAGLPIMRHAFEYLRSRKDTYHEDKSLTAIKLTGAATRLAEFTIDSQEKIKLLTGARDLAEAKGLGPRKKEVEKLLNKLT